MELSLSQTVGVYLLFLIIAPPFYMFYRFISGWPCKTWKEVNIKALHSYENSNHGMVHSLTLYILVDLPMCPGFYGGNR